MTNSIKIVVRFVNGLRDLTIDPSINNGTTGTYTVSDILNDIKSKYPEIAQQSLRIVYHGRLLNEDQLLGDIVRIPTAAAASNANNGTTTSTNDDSTIVDTAEDDTQTVYMHCVISEVQSTSNSQTPQIRNSNRGFDRLLEIGFSREDVENIRQQFRSIRGQANEEEERENEQNAEEAWMDNTANEQPLDDGTNYDLFYGLCIGFFGGVLNFVWLKETLFFSRRQKIGIWIGLMLNFSFGLMRMFYV